jgi:hypothetical protein
VDVWAKLEAVESFHLLVSERSLDGFGCHEPPLESALATGLTLSLLSPNWTTT